jgi:AcrR family transcriptional regulator
VVSARRTQAERTATTTAKLLDAAIDAIVDLGWAGTSTTEVCRRAGVSRGALLHHFPTKSALISAAVDRVMDLRIQEFTVTLSSLPPDTDVVERLELAIDILWGIYQSPIVAVWQELITAARTDADLHELVVATGARLSDEIDRHWRTLFPPDDALPAEFYELAPRFLFVLLDGLALLLVSGAPDAAARAAAVVASTKLIVRSIAAADLTVLTHYAQGLFDERP